MEADTYDVHPRLARAMTTCVRNACRTLRVLLTVFRETMRETQFAPDNGVNTCNRSDKSYFLSFARNCTTTVGNKSNFRTDSLSLPSFKH